MTKRISLPPAARGRRAGAGAATVLAALAGCGENPQHGSVRGVVSVRGERVSDARVLFLPAESKGKGVENPSAFGVTDSQGGYVLQTPADRTPGVRTGTYRVVIDDPTNSAGRAATPPAPDGDREPTEVPAAGKRPPKLPAIYADMIQTPLPMVEVKPGDQTFDFDLK